MRAAGARRAGAPPAAPPRPHGPRPRHGAAARAEGAGLAGKLFLGADGPPRQQALPPDEPAERREHPERDEGGGRPADAVERGRSRGAVRPDSEQREKPEKAAAPEPEAESTPIAAHRRRDPDSPPPAAGEEVAGGGEEGQERRGEHDPESPGSHEPQSQCER